MIQHIIYFNDIWMFETLQNGDFFKTSF